MSSLRAPLTATRGAARIQEKWYTACGSVHPLQAGPECDVEKAMYATFNELKVLNPQITNIMYLNSCAYIMIAF